MEGGTTAAASCLIVIGIFIAFYCFEPTCAILTGNWSRKLAGEPNSVALFERWPERLTKLYVDYIVHYVRPFKKRFSAGEIRLNFQFDPLHRAPAAPWKSSHPHAPIPKRDSERIPIVTMLDWVVVKRCPVVVLTRRLRLASQVAALSWSATFLPRLPVFAPLLAKFDVPTCFEDFMSLAVSG